MRCVLAIAALLVSSTLACAQFPLPGWSGTKSPVISQNRGSPPLSRCPSASEAIPVGIYQYINTCAPTGALTLTLPPASAYTGSSAEVTILDTSGGLTYANYLSLAPSGRDTVAGSTSTQPALLSSLSGENAWITLRSDGVSNWNVASRSVDIQVFSVAGSYTWHQPLGTQNAYVSVQGGGGSGGGGARQASGSSASGGGGGGAGGRQNMMATTSYFQGAMGITVGAGGTGGTGATVNTTAGGVGNAGATSAIGIIRAAGGGAGGGGRLANSSGGGGGGCTFTQGQDASGGTAGGTCIDGFGTSFQAGNGGGSGVVLPNNISAVGSGSGGGGASNAAAGGAAGGLSMDAAGGGGGGGGVIAGPAATAGGQGGDGATGLAGVCLVGGGGGIGSNGGNALMTSGFVDWPGCGGGGGGGSTTTAGNGGNGVFGGGGGGGGSALNGQTTGNGGAGGDGFVSVRAW